MEIFETKHPLIIHWQFTEEWRIVQCCEITGKLFTKHNSTIDSARITHTVPYKQGYHVTAILNHHQLLAGMCARPSDHA